MTVDEKADAIVDGSPKSDVNHVDVVEFEKPEQKLDYAGAAAKTDPEEIRLVRKLDYRILPILFVMYFLNYVDREYIAGVYKDSCADIASRKCNCSSKARWTREGS
jgi:hypothetical protein